MAIAEERIATEKRKQAQAEFRANRAKAADAPEPTEEDNAALDNLLAKLRNGDSVGRKARRTRKSAAARTSSAQPLTLNTDVLLQAKSGDETVDIARDMLMRLKSDGFDALTPSTPTAASMRRSRRKRDSEGVAALAALGESIPPGEPLDELPEEQDNIATPLGTQPTIILDSIEERPDPEPNPT